MFSLHMDTAHHLTYRKYPEPVALLRLIKPITWFPPIWAYLCGSVATGVSLWENFGLVLVGMILAGPIVCGMSQAANDWCDRHVDAVNEPDRPIPSGRVPGRWGLWIALAMTGLALGVGSILGPWGAAATLIGIAAAWAYSAEPIRLKRSGWWGPGLVGLSYEGLPWFTGSAVLLGALPSWENMLLALLYALGAHGIMTLNDFKAIEGDQKMGIRSLPVQLGANRAAQLACLIMLIPQCIVIGFLFFIEQEIHAFFVGILVLAQLALMRYFLFDPIKRALFYSGFGVPLFVGGMMIAAFGIRNLGGQ